MVQEAPECLDSSRLARLVDIDSVTALATSLELVRYRRDQAHQVKRGDYRGTLFVLKVDVSPLLDVRTQPNLFALDRHFEGAQVMPGE
jgi:hypothetical protein